MNNSINSFGNVFNTINVDERYRSNQKAINILIH